MDVEAHLRRTWEVYSARWQEAVAISVLPLILLLALPLVLVFMYVVMGGLVLASFAVSALLDSAGVSNATLWTTVVIVGLALLAGLAAILLLLPLAALSFVVRACLNPTLAQMMSGGKGGLKGFWQVLREDWPVLLVTDIAIFAPVLLLTGVITLPTIALALALGPLGFVAICLVLPLIMVLAAFNIVWMYLTEMATVLVRLEGLSPLAAIKASMSFSRRRFMKLVPAYAGFYLANLFAGQVPFVGFVISQALVYPIWVMYNTSVYLEERDMGGEARAVESRYVVS